MISLDDAFKKFKSRLELTTTEQNDASSKHKKIRDYISQHFSIKDHFLTGSYKRHTKTKPLKDVDIFFVFDEVKEKKYLDDPVLLLSDVTECLQKKYGENNVTPNRRSVEIHFGKSVDNEDEDKKVFSIDVVPAFENGNHYQIPDPEIENGWIHTDPKIHQEKATKANSNFNGEWKPLIKMIKKWNEYHGKPIKPSFLIEVMGLEIFKPPFSGNYVYEIKSFFASAHDEIENTWNDPAGLGPPVSDQMDQTKILKAKKALKNAEKNISKAIQLKNSEKNGSVLKVWREEIFGPRFPLS